MSSTSTVSSQPLSKKNTSSKSFDSVTKPTSTPPLPLATKERDSASAVSMSYSLCEPSDVIKLLESKSESYIILDCQPTLAYNSRHINEAFGLNLNPMIAKRLTAGRVLLEDIVIPKCTGKERYRQADLAVVYDECSSDVETSKNATLKLFIKSLTTSGKTIRLLRGGYRAFQASCPVQCQSIMLETEVPVTHDDMLAWQTAPPVPIMPYIIVGSEKDAASKDCLEKYNIKYVLNVTVHCPNHFEGDQDMKINYFRIPAQDNAKMRLLDYFDVANQFIAEARTSKTSVLIHCVAGISRSVTITIAYLMKQYHMPLQKAYDHVKHRRPAISPNLNFMGQLLEYERMLDLGNDKHSPELLALDPLAMALKESFGLDGPIGGKPGQIDPGQEQQRSGVSELVNGVDVVSSSLERTLSVSSSSSSSSCVGLGGSLTYQRLDSTGIYSGSGLSASFAGNSTAFNLKKPSRKKRPQSEADLTSTGSTVVEKDRDRYGRHNTEPTLPEVKD